jgi:alkane 1-monooxygenase
VKSHHKKVATLEDASTARFGESLFAFWLRAIPQGFVEAWDLEAKRLGPDGKSVVWWEHLLYNRMI